VARKPMNVMKDVVESLLQPLPEGNELAVCERCGCPDAVPPGKDMKDTMEAARSACVT
jgi:hypothetical protein